MTTGEAQLNEDECSDTKLLLNRPNHRRRKIQKIIIKKLNQDKNAKIHFGCALARAILNNISKIMMFNSDYLYRFDFLSSFSLFIMDLGAYVSDFCEYTPNSIHALGLSDVSFLWIDDEYKTKLCTNRCDCTFKRWTTASKKGRASEGEQKINEKLVIDAYKMLMPRHSFNRSLSFYSHNKHWA